MLFWVAITALARPLYVQPEEGEHFRVVDRNGNTISAWHFAHFVRDGKMVNRLRPRMYARRIIAGGSLATGVVAFSSGLGALQARREEIGSTGRFDGPSAIYGTVAAAGLFLAVVPPLNAIRKRRDWERVDQHYTQQQAVEQIRSQTRVWATPVGVYAVF